MSGGFEEDSARYSREVDLARSLSLLLAALLDTGLATALLVADASGGSMRLLSRRSHTRRSFSSLSLVGSSCTTRLGSSLEPSPVDNV